jgi:hypothetical protein
MPSIFYKHYGIKQPLEFDFQRLFTEGRWEIHSWIKNDEPGIKYLGNVSFEPSIVIEGFAGDNVTENHYKIVSKIPVEQHSVESCFEGAVIAYIPIVSDESLHNAIRIMKCVNAMERVSSPERWVKETHELFDKIDAFFEDRNDLKLGHSKLDRLLELARQRDGFAKEISNLNIELKKLQGKPVEPSNEKGAGNE